MRTLAAARVLRAMSLFFGGAGAHATPAAAARGDEAHAPHNDAMAVLGHELRTPLSALMGYTEMLAGAGDLTEAQRRAWSANAHEAACHLNALIAAALDSGAHGLAAPSSVRDVLDVNALARLCCEFVRPDAAARGVTLCPPPPVIGLDMYCDPRAVRQILLNLLSNAIKFTPPGGEVRVWISRNAGDLLLYVADTGIGLEESRRREQTGLGLGLTLVRSLASLQGGGLSIGPGDGGGTLACVTLPDGLSPAANETSAGATVATQMMVPCLA